jgi:hypothetical protein
MIKTLLTTKTQAIFSVSALITAVTPSLPFARVLIESSMTFHMLFQIPMLIFAGYLLKNKPKKVQYTLFESTAQWLWIYLSSTFWMLPISIDKALLYPPWDVFKLLSLLITGAVLKVVFQSNRLLALFFIGSMAMMLFFVGFYYQQTDTRLCNAYLIESQQVTGLGLIVIACLLLSFLFFKIQRNLVATDNLPPNQSD